MPVLLGELSREALVARSRERGEPEWLTEARAKAWEAYQGLRLPGPHDEDWRRTDVSRVRLPEVVAEAPGGPTAPLPERLRKVAESGKALVLEGGAVTARPAGLPDGVVVTDLETAAREHPDLVQEHLMRRAVRADEHIFAALHAAIWRGGVFIYVPPGVRVEEPIHTVEWAGGAGAGLFGHTLIVAEAGAEVAIAQYLGSAATPDRTVQAGAVEIWAKPGAQVRYASVQNWGSGVWSFMTRRALVQKDARVDWLIGEFGGSLVRSEQRTVLDEPGAQGNLKLVFFGSGDQHIDLVAEDLHVPGSHRSAGDILGRGVLADSARAVFRGVGHIMRGAKGCECFLRENALLLNRGCRVDSIPSLFIDDDDVVRGGHAATSGRVDDEELFYLRSRGIPENRAKRLIVTGFLQPLLEAAQGTGLRSEIESLIDGKLGL